VNELTDIQYNNTLEEYYPFGDSSLRTFTKKRYRYVGKEKDAESGLYYYGARYYSAWTCRFISVDPLADKYAQLSPYNYADNNPVGDLDVDGMQNTGTEETKTSENNGNANEEIPDFAVGTTFLKEAVVYGYKIGGFSDYNKNDSLSLSNYESYSFGDNLTTYDFVPMYSGSMKDWRQDYYPNQKEKTDAQLEQLWQSQFSAYKQAFFPEKQQSLGYSSAYYFWYYNYSDPKVRMLDYAKTYPGMAMLWFAHESGTLDMLKTYLDYSMAFASPEPLGISEFKPNFAFRAVEESMSDVQLLTRAAQKAEAAIGGTG